MDSDEATAAARLDAAADSPGAGMHGMNEADWYALWHERIVGDATPALLALGGGLLANALPWVFISGYQAAVRQVYPELPAAGWAALAASEDRNDVVANPPARLFASGGAFRLEGTKSWVAQSRHVDQLVVTARAADDETVAVHVARDRPGLEIRDRPPGRFLSAMSQGFACFEGVSVSAAEVLPDARLKTFMKTESKCIMLSLCAFFFVRAAGRGEGLAEKARRLALDLFAACAEPNLPAVDLAALDTRLQEVSAGLERAGAFDDVPDWSGDCRLVSMYSAGIQKRAARAVSDGG